MGDVLKWLKLVVWTTGQRARPLPHPSPHAACGWLPAMCPSRCSVQSGLGPPPVLTGPCLLQAVPLLPLSEPEAAGRHYLYAVQLLAGCQGEVSAHATDDFWCQGVSLGSCRAIEPVPVKGLGSALRSSQQIRAQAGAPGCSSPALALCLSFRGGAPSCPHAPPS